MDRCLSALAKVLLHRDYLAKLITSRDDGGSEADSVLTTDGNELLSLVLVLLTSLVVTDPSQAILVVHLGESMCCYHYLPRSH